MIQRLNWSTFLSEFIKRIAKCTFLYHYNICIHDVWLVFVGSFSKNCFTYILLMSKNKLVAAFWMYDGKFFWLIIFFADCDMSNLNDEWFCDENSLMKIYW